MKKVRISLTVKRETVDNLDKLAKELFPAIEVSRGDVIDYLTEEVLRVIKERGTALVLFPHKNQE